MDGEKCVMSTGSIAGNPRLLKARETGRDLGRVGCDNDKEAVTSVNAVPGEQRLRLYSHIVGNTVTCLKAGETTRTGELSAALETWKPGCTAIWSDVCHLIPLSHFVIVDQWE
jgi:hypothetical protein